MQIQARRRRFYGLFPAGAMVALCSGSWPAAQAQQAVPAREESRTDPKPVDDDLQPDLRASRPSIPEPAGAKRLDPNYPVWVDMKEKAVIVDGLVCLRKGMLEMFACLRNTKEHEAIVAADTKAYLVHTGLLAIGAQTGSPAKFQPEYKPPSGTEIDITLHWKDKQGKEQSARAQDWVMDLKTKKVMAYPFVFGGSSFWTDPESKKKFYQAEGGDFVCVSNFGTAMLDIPVKSSQSNEELEFEAFTEKIPPIGTPIRMVFKPKVDKKPAEAGAKPAGAAPKAAGEPRTTDGKAK